VLRTLGTIYSLQDLSIINRFLQIIILIFNYINHKIFNIFCKTCVYVIRFPRPPPFGPPVFGRPPFDGMHPPRPPFMPGFPRMPMPPRNYPRIPSPMMPMALGWPILDTTWAPPSDDFGHFVEINNFGLNFVIE